MKRLHILLLIPIGLFIITAFGSCANADAQQVIHGTPGYHSDSGRPPGPDHNPATYDENPQNLPQSVVRTYVNTDGLEVQSPTAYKAPPPGACAICNDGEYSQSKHRKGTCSRHGGVKEWLKELP